MNIYNGLAAGIVIINYKDSEILIGERVDGQGWGFVAGKKEESDKNTKETALRELKEEFGIDIKDTEHVEFCGRAFVCADKINRYSKKVIEKRGYFSDIYVYMTTEQIKPCCSDGEMLKIKWVKIDDFFKLDNIFPPSLIAFNVACPNGLLQLESGKFVER